MKVWNHVNELPINTTSFPKNGLVKAWTDNVPLDERSVRQINNIASMPFIYKHVAVMPDAHWGTGCTIGSVIATRGAIIPAAVGVDIGCGIMASLTTLTASDLPDNLHRLRTEIEATVPHGRTDDGGANDVGSWEDMPEHIQSSWDELKGAYAGILAKHPKIRRRQGPKTVEHLGTLGTGNHFIEICLDENQRVWVMLHSGSRGVGNRIGMYFIELAKKDMKTWFVDTPNADLAYLPEGTSHFDDYIEAVGWAQKFALQNRTIMMSRVMVALYSVVMPEAQPLEPCQQIVSCHHNYVTREHHFGSNVLVTRKGAVNAREGVMGIIPGSMGAKSYIVKGKGNPESFHSCSHGAGRVMSRGEARRTITLEEHAKAVQGVECRLDADVIDESPAAYKDLDAVMEAQKDLVEIVHTLKQVVNIKG